MSSSSPRLPRSGRSSTRPPSRLSFPGNGQRLLAAVHTKAARRRLLFHNVLTRRRRSGSELRGKLFELSQASAPPLKEPHFFMLCLILRVLMADKGAVAGTVRRRLHRDFRRHEGFRVWPEQRAESIGPDQALLRLRNEDAPRLFRKGCPFWRTHHDVEHAAGYKLDSGLNDALRLWREPLLQQMWL